MLLTLGGTESCNVLRAEGRQFPITYSHTGRVGTIHGQLFRDVNVKLLAKTGADAAVEGLNIAPSGETYWCDCPVRRRIAARWKNSVQEYHMTL